MTKHPREKELKNQSLYLRHPTSQVQARLWWPTIASVGGKQGEAVKITGELTPFVFSVMYYLHIRATGDAWPWKPIPWSSWVTVSVLMLTAEEVLCSAITESDFYAVCNLVWFFKNPILCNRHYGPQCPLHSLPLQSVKRAWKRCSTLQ